MLPVFWSVIGSVKRLFAIVGVSRTPKVDDFVKAVFTTGRRQTETLYYAKDMQSLLEAEIICREDGEFGWLVLGPVIFQGLGPGRGNGITA
nr:hypothetical protein BaRGS_002887 [Batillaria attramentaria]